MRYLNERFVKFEEENKESIIRWLGKPPDSTAVCASNVLAEVVQEDSVSAEDVENQKTSWGLIFSDLLYQLRILWMSSSSWLILCRKSPCLRKYILFLIFQRPWDLIWKRSLDLNIWIVSLWSILVTSMSGHCNQELRVKWRIFQLLVDYQTKQVCHLHVDQSVVRDGKPFREIESKSLFPICEDVPGHLWEAASEF